VCDVPCPKFSRCLASVSLRFARHVKRDLSLSKETYHDQKKLSKETYNYLMTVMSPTLTCCDVPAELSKETHHCQKRRIIITRDVSLSKETYHCRKRLIIAKRDFSLPKETYLCQKRRIFVKRDCSLSKGTHHCQKRPIIVKRDVLGSGVCALPRLCRAGSCVM